MKNRGLEIHKQASWSKNDMVQYATENNDN